MTKKVIICADDFGLMSEISEGILNLIKNKRISATSCMTSIKGWFEDAQKLQPFSDQVDVGLHLNLTEGPFLNLPKEFSLPELIIKSFLNLLDETTIAQELEAQILKFQEAMGKLPDFLDGHQHIHVLPKIRQVVLKLYEKYFPDKKTYIRIPIVSAGSVAKFKSSVISLAGAKQLKFLLVKKQIPHNCSFEGIYDFSQADQFPQFFVQFMTNIQPHGLIMCHPGIGQNLSNLKGPSRAVEYQYLAGDQYLENRRKVGVEICRFFS